MVITLELILLAITVVLGVPVLLLLFQVLMAMRASTVDVRPLGRRPRIAVLIPAHDEETGIAKTLSCIAAQLQPGDRLVVVADNCSDNTAAVAMNCGAEVCERRDAERRGKSYALDHGMRYLAAEPPEVVIIIDADCIVKDGTIDTLACEALRSGRPVQALYMMYTQTREKLTSRIAEFAWLVKNHVRPLGLLRAGMPCQLMGTGMAFPWHVIHLAPIASGHLAEDMKLGLDLAVDGAPPLFAPQAEVFSYFPLSASGTKAQRTRWEHGHLGVILHDVPRLMMAALRNRNRPLFMLALDLLVPPLALLTLLVGAVFLGAAALYIATGAAIAVTAGAVVIAGLCMAIALSWLRFGRHILDAADLLMALVYAAWKIPVYFRFFVKKQVEWIRSERDAR